MKAVKKVIKYQNRISFNGVIESADINFAIRLIYNAIYKSEYQIIDLNFSDCTRVFPLSMLRLCSFITVEGNKNIVFHLHFGANTKLKKRMIDTNWASIIDVNYPKSSYTGELMIPTIQFIDQSEQLKAVNNVMRTLLSAFDEIDRKNFGSIEWAINEITDNVLNHSGSSIGGYLYLEITRTGKKKIEFCVSDSGVGIPESLRNAYPGEVDTQLVINSIKKGVTNGFGMGNGLYGTSEMSRISDGFFSIESGEILLTSNKKKGVAARGLRSRQVGTTIYSIINTDEPGMLIKALTFEGKQHELVDFLETKYEMNSDLNVYHHSFFKEEDPTGSRMHGKILRKEFEAILRLSEICTIVMDFKGISIISSSFADELIAKSYKKLGREIFEMTYNIVNTNENINSIIASTLSQRNTL